MVDTEGECVILYHGTSVEAARQIQLYGFIPDKKYNWKIRSKKGFVYLSLAYAPFYAEAAKSKSRMRALVKVSVPSSKLYPEDDFLMYALKKPKYSQADLDRINLEQYKHAAKASLQYMGNAAAKPRDIKVLGVREFNAKHLGQVCDPSISPLNYMIMSKYYRALTEWIYQGKDPLQFRDPSMMGLIG